MVLRTAGESLPQQLLSWFKKIKIDEKWETEKPDKTKKEGMSLEGKSCFQMASQKELMKHLSISSKFVFLDSRLCSCCVFVAEMHACYIYPVKYKSFHSEPKQWW